MGVLIVNILESPYIDQLDYFVEWGGYGWTKLIRKAFVRHMPTELTGMRILELGARNGKMACLFALLGSYVHGVDVDANSVLSAQQEAMRWNVTSRTEFVAYDGSLDIFPDNHFDVIFTKSVLVVVPQLVNTLTKISAKLKPTGTAIFVENAKGSEIIHRIRGLGSRQWDFTKVNYFEPRHIEMFRSILDVTHVEKTLVPPIYLIVGGKPK
jgi:ubiquinone/menaquinone biosynthesis C-methylase UbiE